MTIEQFCRHLMLRGAFYSRFGNRVALDCDFFLAPLGVFPSGLELSNTGTIDLGGLRELPGHSTLSAGNSVLAAELVEIGEGFRLTAGSIISIPRLASLPESVSLSSGKFAFGKLRQKWNGYELDHSLGHIIEGRRILRSFKGGHVSRARYFTGAGELGEIVYIYEYHEKVAHGREQAEAVHLWNRLYGKDGK